MNNLLRCTNNRGGENSSFNQLRNISNHALLVEDMGYIHKLKVELGLIEAPFAPDY